MQVGDYVRLDKNRGIRKIIDYSEHIDYYVFDKPVLDRWGKDTKSHFAIKEQILKSSPNIIDLIQEGDYVNGIKVGYIDDCNGAMREYNYIFEDEKHDVGHYEEEIHSVVTKEQFEEMEYKI